MKQVLGHQRSQKILLLMAKNVRCRLEFAQRQQDWTIHEETKINQFQYDGRTWCWVRMENHNYKLIVQVKHLNMEVV